MERKHLFIPAVLMMLLFCINSAKADVETMTRNGYVLWGTNTPFWYSDSVSIHYGNEKVHLKGDTTIINLTKGMGAETISSLRIGSFFNFFIDNASKEITPDDVEAMLIVRLSPFSLTSTGGTNILNIDYNNTKENKAELSLFQQGDLSESFSNIRSITSGSYLWQGIYHNEDTKHAGTIIINSPQMLYFVDNNEKVIKNVKTGDDLLLTPVIRSGYPWDDRKERFKGDASWTLTDEKGNIIKQGVHTFTVETETADTSMEFVEKLDAISLEVLLCKKITFNITYPDQATDSYSVNISDYLFTSAYLGGGVYGVLDFRYDNNGVSECLSVNPDYEKVGYFTAPETKVYAGLSIFKPEYLPFNFAEVNKKVSGEVLIYDLYGFVEDTVFVADLYNSLYDKIETLDYSSPSFLSRNKAVTIPCGGEYNVDYDLYVGNDEDPVAQSWDNKVVFQVDPFVKCFPKVVNPEPDGAFTFAPMVSTGYPYNSNEWQNREYTFYMAFPGDSYEKITSENPKHTVSFSADSYLTLRESRKTYVFNHNLYDYGVDSLVFVTANEEEHSLDTICIVKSETTTGIVSVKKPITSSDNKTFSIDGRYLGTGDANLPKGIYIQNRRKIIHY